MRLGFVIVSSQVAFAAFALPAAAATVITEYDRAGFTEYLEGVVETVENFDGVPVSGPAGEAISSPLTALGGMTLWTDGEPLVVTDARNASSGVQSLAANLGLSNYNIAADQTVTFSFAKSVVAFAIDVNTFLQGTENTVGDFFAEIWAEDGSLLGTVSSIYSPFPNNSKPVSGVGQFIGFSSSTPFGSVTVGQKTPLKTDVNGFNYPYSLDTLIRVDDVEPPPPPPPPPIPLPLPMALLLSGLAALAVVARRKHA